MSAEHPGGDLGQEIARPLPYLRRYARALSGDQRIGDGLVRASLERMLAAPGLIDRGALKVALYRVLNSVWSGLGDNGAGSGAGSTIENARIVAGRIAELGGPQRQVLLLATLEGLSPSQVAAVMGMAEDEVR